MRWAVALGMAFVAACWDARTRRIPNLLTLPVLLSGLSLAAIQGGIGDALTGMLLLGIPYFLLFAFAGGGAGDAKAMAAIGAWVGGHDSIIVLVAVALSGGVLGVLYALLQKRLRGVVSNLRMVAFGVALMAVRKGDVKQGQQFVPASGSMLRMPYGLAIFAGTVCAAGWVMIWP